MSLFLKIIRYREWYDSKWNIYLYIYMLYWIRHQEKETVLCVKGLIVVMVFSFFISAFGYTFNEYSDKGEDLLVGKMNYIAQIHKSWQLIIIFIMFFIGVVFPVCLVPTICMSIIVLLAFFMAFLYSFRRIRIKQCGIWGVVVSSLAQRVCPLFVIFYLFDDWSATTVLVMLLSFIIGIRWVLIHQAEDQNNDKVSNTNSFVVSLNNESKLITIITTVFACELLCLISILILNVSFSWAVIIPITYVIFQMILMPFWSKIGWKRMILSYDFAPLADFYFLWTGVYVATALALSNSVCSVLFLPVLYFGYRYVILNCKYLILNYKANRGLISSPTQQNNN